MLSAFISIALPFLEGGSIKQPGTLPMVINYTLAWGIVKWRREYTGYFHKNAGKPPIVFSINLAVIGAALIFAYRARVAVSSPDTVGIIITALCWATISASSEQLLWIYIFESWDCFTQANRKTLMRIAGLGFFTLFVGMIHIRFWTLFGEAADPKFTAGIIFVILTSISGYLHLILWRKSSRMIYTFIPHFLLTLVPLFWTGYSILPYLIR